MSEPDYPVSPRGRLIDPGATDDERSYSLLMHLTLLAHLIVPYVAIIAPIIMWLVRKEKSSYIDDHGREAVNFQITLLLYTIILPAIAAIIGVITCSVGFVLLVPAIFGPYILGLVGMIMGAMAANRGEFFRYPMTLRLLH